jgi:hypothetical protein
MMDQGSDGVWPQGAAGPSCHGRRENTKEREGAIGTQIFTLRVGHEAWRRSRGVHMEREAQYSGSSEIGGAAPDPMVVSRVCGSKGVCPLAA